MEPWVRSVLNHDSPSAVGGQTYLALSSEPIEIPNPLAPLLKRLVTIAERNPQAIRGESSAP